MAVYGVPAYSTLGRLPGDFFADPLLSTFIGGLPEIELARMIFHELAHQVAYADSDTVFNESYATAVERLGGARWAALHADAAARAAQAVLDARRDDFRALAARTRQALDDDLPRRRERRRQARRQGRRDGARCAPATPRSRPGRGRASAATTAGSSAPTTPRSPCSAPTTSWCRRSCACYEREGGDFGRFHAEVRRIAALPRAERRAALAG